MKIHELARIIEARLAVPSTGKNSDVTRVFGANTMSDLIANSAADTILVTTLSNTQLVRVAELMDVPGICLVDGREPDAQLAARARETGTALLVAAGGFADTVQRMTAALGAAGASPS